jgi:hypothetical protein
MSAVETAVVGKLLNLADDVLARVVWKCADATASFARTATGSTFKLTGPSWHIVCTSKRLRDCWKKDPAWAELLAGKRTAFLEGLFWSRVRFCSKAWGAVQRAAVLGLAARAEQVHVLQKGGQALTMTAEFVRRKGDECHIELALHIQGDATTGLNGALGHMHIDLPPAYATKPEKRTREQHMEMREWMRDRSAAVDKRFAELNKRFAEVGRPIFAYW